MIPWRLLGTTLRVMYSKYESGWNKKLILYTGTWKPESERHIGENNNNH